MATLAVCPPALQPHQHQQRSNRPAARRTRHIFRAAAQHEKGDQLDDRSGRASTTSRRRLLSTAAPVFACSCPACGGGPRKPRNRVADEAFALSMATGMQDYEVAIAPTKRRLFAQLLESLPSSSSSSSPPTVLDVGAGAGPNLPYLRKGGADLSLLALDPNPSMRSYLEQAAARVNWPAGRLTWMEGAAEALPLPDASVDAVVCTLVLCSVDSVPPVVQELRRVLRPGGKLLFIEHTRADLRKAPLLRAGQFLFNPLQVALADGCHLDRDPLPAIEDAGFSSVEAERFTVKGMALIAPHVAGLATA